MPVLILLLAVSSLAPYGCASRARLQRALAPAKHQAQILWQKSFGETDFAGTLLISGSEVTSFLHSEEAMPEFGGELVSYSLEDGTETWNMKVPFEMSDVLFLLANTTSYFAITGAGVDSYDRSSGRLLWSSTLGVGHVEVAAQLEGSIIRVYYGQTIIELDSQTGGIVDSYPKGNTLWKVGDLEISANASSRVTATESTSGRTLWDSDLEPFRIDEPWTPQLVGAHTLLVHPISGSAGYCGLDLADGTAEWCTQDNPVSNISVSANEDEAYYVRDDFTLVRLRLSNGHAEAEIPFMPPVLPSSMTGLRFTHWVGANDNRIGVLFTDSNQLFILESLD